MKVYKEKGNSKQVKKKYCMEHFIKRFGRHPNISDVATFGACDDCKPWID